MGFLWPTSLSGLLRCGFGQWWQGQEWCPNIWEHGCPADSVICPVQFECTEEWATHGVPSPAPWVPKCNLPTRECISVHLFICITCNLIYCQIDGQYLRQIVNTVLNHKKCTLLWVHTSTHFILLWVLPRHAYLELVYNGILWRDNFAFFPK